MNQSRRRVPRASILKRPRREHGPHIEVLEQRQLLSSAQLAATVSNLPVGATLNADVNLRRRGHKQRAGVSYGRDLDGGVSRQRGWWPQR
jgi:hypothetical protein